MSDFATLLRYLRAKYGVSQQIVADGAGFDKSFISRLESDERRPSRNVILLLAQSLGLSDDETDDLLLSAEYAPVQVKSLLNIPELARLDDLIATASAQNRTEALDTIHTLTESLGRSGSEVWKQEVAHASRS